MLTDFLVLSYRCVYRNKESKYAPVLKHCAITTLFLTSAQAYGQLHTPAAFPHRKNSSRITLDRCQFGLGNGEKNPVLAIIENRTRLNHRPVILPTRLSRPISYMCSELTHTPSTTRPRVHHLQLVN
jgi:hypothetical protein